MRFKDNLIYLIKESNDCSDVKINSSSFNTDKLKEFVINSRIENYFLDLTDQNFIWDEKHLQAKKDIEVSGFKRLIKSLENIRYLNEFIVAMKLESIDFLLLKGAYLSSSVYQKISHRPINDIDILIRNKHNESVVKILSKLKLQPIKTINTSDFHLKPIVCSSKTVRFDVHNKIFKEPINTDLLFDTAEEVKIFGERCLIPQKEVFTSHLIEHGTSKGSFDVGVQYLFDIYQMRKKNLINESKLSVFCNEYNLNKELQITNNIYDSFFSNNITKTDSLDSAELNAAFNILLGPFIHDKTSLFLDTTNRNNFNLVKFHKGKPSIAKVLKNISRVLHLIYSYSNMMYKIIFLKKYKKVQRSKKIIRKYFK